MQLGSLNRKYILWRRNYDEHDIYMGSNRTEEHFGRHGGSDLLEKEGTDSDGNVGSFAGATPFDNGDPTADDYIAFADLTEADVLGWIQAVVVGDYETHVNSQIQKQIDQLAVSDADMPWAPAPEPAPADDAA